MHSARLLAFISVLAGVLHLVPAHGTDYSVECSGAAVDTEIDTAIAQAQNGPVRVLLSPGTCLLESTHVLNGAIEFSIVGAGVASTIVKGQGFVFPIFRVGLTSGGVNFGLRALTLRDAPFATVVMFYSTLRVDAVQFSDNKSGTVVIHAEFSTVTIANSRFEGNTSDEGAISVSGGLAGHLNVTDTAFVGNSTSQDGGAINANASVVLDRVTFTGNTASSYGGAVYMSELDLTIRNSTFSGNSAAYGGAIAMKANFDSPGPILLRNVTMHGDAASLGGSEIYSGGSLPPPIAIFNSLIGGTCAGPAITMTAHGSVESPGDTCGMAAIDNQINVPDGNLHLGPPSDNGGATLTLYPNAGSVLIDAAGIDCESVDQRDLVRNAGACDVGAVEAGATLADGIFAEDFDG